ncbi:hypothetical protein JCM9803A_63000 [Rhodococcus erythropolis]
MTETTAQPLTREDIMAAVIEALGTGTVNVTNAIKSESVRLVGKSERAARDRHPAGRAINNPPTHDEIPAATSEEPKSRDTETLKAFDRSLLSAIPDGVNADSQWRRSPKVDPQPEASDGPLQLVGDRPYAQLEHTSRLIECISNIGPEMPFDHERNLVRVLVDQLTFLAEGVGNDNRVVDLLAPLSLALEPFRDRLDLLGDRDSVGVGTVANDVVRKFGDASGVRSPGLTGPGSVPEFHETSPSVDGCGDLTVGEAGSVGGTSVPPTEKADDPRISARYDRALNMIAISVDGEDDVYLPRDGAFTFSDEIAQALEVQAKLGGAA